MRVALLLATMLMSIVNIVIGNPSTADNRTYQLRTEVTDINEETGDVFLTDESGNAWIYSGINCMVGDQYILVMSNCGTEGIFDDVIENVIVA